MPRFFESLDMSEAGDNHMTNTPIHVHVYTLVLRCSSLKTMTILDLTALLCGGVEQHGKEMGYCVHACELLSNGLNLSSKVS